MLANDSQRLFELDMIPDEKLVIVPTLTHLPTLTLPPYTDPLPTLLGLVLVLGGQQHST